MTRHVIRSRSTIRPQDLSAFTLCVQTSRSEQSIDLATLSDQLIGQEWQSTGVLGIAFKKSSEYERSPGELRIPVNWLSVCE